MYDSFAASTPLTGPHPLSRPRAVLGALRRDAGQARVVMLPDGSGRVVRRGERLRLSDALAGRYRAVYHVDEDGHTVDVTCELPGGNGGLPFEARIRLLWWVHDVERAVQARVGDVRHALEPILVAHLGRFTREHTGGQLTAAEDRVRRELAGDLPLDIGLTVRTLAVTLRVDQATAPGDVDPLEQVRRDIALETERGRLAVLRARNEVAAWQVRLAFYRDVVESGLPALLALRLMVDPASATEVAGYAPRARDHDGRPWPAWPDPEAVEGGRPAGDQPGEPAGAVRDVVYVPDDPDRDR